MTDWLGITQAQSECSPPPHHNQRRSPASTRWPRRADQPSIRKMGRCLFKDSRELSICSFYRSLFKLHIMKNVMISMSTPPRFVNALPFSPGFSGCLGVCLVLDLFQAGRAEEGRATNAGTSSGPAISRQRDTYWTKHFVPTAVHGRQ